MLNNAGITDTSTQLQIVTIPLFPSAFSPFTFGLCTFGY